MRVIEPKIVLMSKVNGEDVLELIEQTGRVCYKSEERITDGSANA